MKALRSRHKTSAKAAALRKQIRLIWLGRAQRFPFEAVTASLIQQLLPTRVHRNTIQKHMDEIRRETSVKRAIKAVLSTPRFPAPTAPRRPR